MPSVQPDFWEREPTWFNLDWYLLVYPTLSCSSQKQVNQLKSGLPVDEEGLRRGRGFRSWMMLWKAPGPGLALGMPTETLRALLLRSPHGVGTQTCICVWPAQAQGG